MRPQQSRHLFWCLGHGYRTPYTSMLVPANEPRISRGYVVNLIYSHVYFLAVWPMKRGNKMGKGASAID